MNTREIDELYDRLKHWWKQIDEYKSFVDDSKCARVVEHYKYMIEISKASLEVDIKKLRAARVRVPEKEEVYNMHWRFIKKEA